MPYAPPIYQRPQGKKIETRHKNYNLKRGSIEQLYGSVRWKKKRHQILIRDKYLCVICKSENKIQLARLVDHIRPAKLRPDLFFVDDNLRSLCIECHAKHGAKITTG